MEENKHRKKSRYIKICIQRNRETDKEVNREKEKNKERNNNNET